jgi:hypothetical protein
MSGRRYRPTSLRGSFFARRIGCARPISSKASVLRRLRPNSDYPSIWSQIRWRGLCSFLPYAPRKQLSRPSFMIWTKARQSQQLGIRGRSWSMPVPVQERRAPLFTG